MEKNNRYISPAVIAMHIDQEGLLCQSTAGRLSAEIENVGQGNDYGDL